MVYGQFVRFMFPLMITAVALELGWQFLNGGMARMPQATRTLAAFGLAWGLKDFLGSSIWQARQLGLVLSDSHRARGKLQLFLFLFALPFALALALMGGTRMGDWVIEDLHGVEEDVAQVVMVALLWLAPLPLVEGQQRFYSGLLLRVRRTDVVSYATVAGIVVSIAAVFVLLPTEVVRQRPIRLPIAVTYIGVLVNLAILLWGYRRYVRQVLQEEGEELSFNYIFGFFWPLGLVLAIQGLSRPLINLFVSRGADGTEALAVLAVIYPLGMFPYVWINEMRSLPAAFGEMEDSRYYIRRFIGASGLVSFLIAIVLFWTPLRDYVLEQLIGLERGLAALCRTPLLLLAFFPLVVMVRAYANGVALVERRTQALVPSAPARLGIIVVVLFVLQFTDIHGAELGIAALLSGFVLEASVMWWGVFGRGYFQRRNL